MKKLATFLTAFMLVATPVFATETAQGVLGASEEANGASNNSALIIVLGLGLLVIVGAALFFLAARRDNQQD